MADSELYLVFINESVTNVDVFIFPSQEQDKTLTSEETATLLGKLDLKVVKMEGKSKEGASSTRTRHELDVGNIGMLRSIVVSSPRWRHCRPMFYLCNK